MCCLFQLFDFILTATKILSLHFTHYKNVAVEFMLLNSYVYFRSDNMLQHYLSILVILNTAKLYEALEHCSDSTYSVYGHSLSSHVNSTRISSSLSDCVMTCQNEFHCKSLNFRLKDKSCDLNDADRYTHPEDYGPQEGSVYMDTSVKHKKVGAYIGLLIISISRILLVY